MRWDPDEYLRRRTERSRAYDELLARVDVVDAELVVDRLRAIVAPRGALAIGVPASFDQPSHVLPRSLAADTAFAPWTAGLTWPSAAAPETYLDALSGPEWRVDVWQSTYWHVLDGPEPVLGRISGTGARPVLEALPDAERAQFRRRCAEAAADAYPARPDGTVVLPFTRAFAVAHRR